MSIEIRDIQKTFGSFTALRDVSLDVATGELVALLGPSGSGKTTLLRIIAGLEAQDTGAIRFHGEDATNAGVRERGVGFVFQHYALFRHMSVFENVAFGLRVKARGVRPSKAAIREKVQRLLELVLLDRMADRLPTQLSGGQRQRVALARALAVEPKVLLLDEPFGALDAQVRKELRRWLRRLHDEMHITSVFVTHDQEEALEVADRIVVMNSGRVEQQGTPEEVYNRPANSFVYNFLGNVNLFHGRVHEGKAQIGDFRIEAPEHAEAQDAPAVGFARPHEIEVERQGATGGGDCLETVIRRVHPVGPVVRVELQGKQLGETIEAELSQERYAELRLRAGETVFVRPRAIRVFVNDFSI
ncbi:MAG: sulfate/molybdate ABC transporter ATP-binding protein [Deltaproteobacteria bacterium]|nr:sulfate/molybdate ABC transporter ATP-binding protein [Deltaproteobacteria bacterium]